MPTTPCLTSAFSTPADPVGRPARPHNGWRTHHCATVRPWTTADSSASATPSSGTCGPRTLSDGTVAGYLVGVRQFRVFLEARGDELEAATRADLEAFIAELLTSRSAATASTRYKQLQALYRWLEDEEEIALNPMARMKPPIVPDKPIPVVPEDALRRLLAACAGKGFEARRDTALITFLLDTGARRGEVAGLRVADLDFDLDVALVLGKGRRERALPFGHTTAVALDRYLHPISSATPSPTNGSRRAAARPISCGWPAGSPAPCSSATVPRPPTPGPARPTAACLPPTGYEDDERFLITVLRPGLFPRIAPATWANDVPLETATKRSTPRVMTIPA